MIPIPSGVRVWIATGHTDMRRGMNGLALQVQQALKRDPHAGDLFVFRGRRGNLVKVLWHDALGMSLYAKRLELELEDLEAAAAEDEIAAEMAAAGPVARPRWFRHTRAASRCANHCPRICRASESWCRVLPPARAAARRGFPSSAKTSPRRSGIVTLAKNRRFPSRFGLATSVLRH